ncbi:MAG: DUF6506 family protein [Candidatus Merdivicinus sp.]|jgi:hypothetical protein
MKKFAFILMGGDFHPEKDTACFETPGGITSIFTVRSLQEAEKRAIECAAEGYGVIELCGAFGEEGASKIREATNDKIGVGYVIHDPAQDDIFAEFFSGK